MAKKLETILVHQYLGARIESNAGKYLRKIPKHLNPI